MPKDIKSIEEIQEGLADFEVRISALELSMPNITPEVIKAETEETPWSRKQWDYVQQILVEMKHFRKQWYEHLKEDREYRTEKRKKIKGAISIDSRNT